jgi:STE24 endopeptidase
MIKNIFSMGFIMFLFFFIFGNLPIDLFNEMHIENNAYASIIVFLLFSDMLGFLLFPLINLLSRHNEFEADKFGADNTDKKDLISALIKLVKENKSFPKSHYLYVLFYYSHPPIIDRLKELGENIENR